MSIIKGLTSGTKDIRGIFRSIRIASFFVIWILLGFALSIMVFFTSVCLVLLNYMINSSTVNFYFPFYFNWYDMFFNLNYASWVFINNIIYFTILWGFISYITGYVLSLILIFAYFIRLKTRKTSFWK